MTNLDLKRLKRQIMEVDQLEQDLDNNILSRSNHTPSMVEVGEGPSPRKT